MQRAPDQLRLARDESASTSCRCAVRVAGVCRCVVAGVGTGTAGRVGVRAGVGTGTARRRGARTVRGTRQSSGLTGRCA